MKELGLSLAEALNKPNIMSHLQNFLSARNFLFFTAGRRVRPARV